MGRLKARIRFQTTCFRMPSFFLECRLFWHHFAVRLAWVRRIFWGFGTGVVWKCKDSVPAMQKSAKA